MTLSSGVAVGSHTALTFLLPFRNSLTVFALCCGALSIIINFLISYVLILPQTMPAQKCGPVLDLADTFPQLRGSNDAACPGYCLFNVFEPEASKSHCQTDIISCPVLFDQNVLPSNMFDLMNFCSSVYLFVRFRLSYSEEFYQKFLVLF